MPTLSPEWDAWALVNGIPAAFGSLLFFAYRPFAERFAWNILDRRTAIFFGTGFLLRAGLFIHIFTASAWPEIRWMTWGNAVFATVLLGVTLVWGDFFHWRRPIAIIWLILYIEEPIWMLTLVPQAQAAASGALPGGDILLVTRAVLLTESAVMLLAGIYLLFQDRFTVVAWPWIPDAVSARIMAGFPLAWAAWAPALAFAPSWPEARAGLALNILWLASIVVSVLVARRTFDLGARLTRLHVGIASALLALVLLSFVLQETAAE
jgi:hypothetical protein